MCVKYGMPYIRVAVCLDCVVVRVGACFPVVIVVVVVRGSAWFVLLRVSCPASLVLLYVEHAFCRPCFA